MEIASRSQRLGLTPERLQTFIEVLVTTKDPDRAHASAIEGLDIPRQDEPFIRSLLGGNPLAQLLREGYAPKK